jgi:hypothetical protein
MDFYFCRFKENLLFVKYPVSEKPAISHLPAATYQRRISYIGSFLIFNTSFS